MKPVTLLDTGPLVALLDRSEREHARVVRLVGGLDAPFVTAEPVLAERFARGEIDEQEYQSRLATLRGKQQSTSGT